MSTAPVLAATAWKNNAELIADCARLNYLRFEWLTLDPTYGRGAWWKTWRPGLLITHDKYTLDGVDFTALPYDGGHFDAAVFDPPYVSKGGRDTTTMPDYANRYGIDRAPKTPAALQAELINPGLAEVVRVVRRSGFVLVKCQDYISSARFWPGTHHTLAHALDLGCQLVDRLEHVARSPRAQPTTNPDGSPRRQVHARRNLSTLLVLKTPRKR